MKILDLITSEIGRRRSNPLFSSYLLVLFGTNWKIAAAVVFGPDDKTIGRTAYIHSLLIKSGTNEYLWSYFLTPLLWAFCIVAFSVVLSRLYMYTDHWLTKVKRDHDNYLKNLSKLSDELGYNSTKYVMSVHSTIGNVSQDLQLFITEYNQTKKTTPDVMMFHITRNAAELVSRAETTISNLNKNHIEQWEKVNNSFDQLGESSKRLLGFFSKLSKQEWMQKRWWLRFTRPRRK